MLLVSDAKKNQKLIKLIDICDIYPRFVSFFRFLNKSLKYVLPI